MFPKKKSGAEYKKIRDAKQAESEKNAQKISKFFNRQYTCFILDKHSIKWVFAIFFLKIKLFDVLESNELNTQNDEPIDNTDIDPNENDDVMETDDANGNLLLLILSFGRFFILWLRQIKFYLFY